LRASWFAQELLSSFEGAIDEVALKPGSGGIFEIRLEGDVLATNRDGRPMPDASEVKRLLRDRIAPERRIGHD
jgi:selenoprotein W-related protein